MSGNEAMPTRGGSRKPLLAASRQSSWKEELPDGLLATETSLPCGASSEPAAADVHVEGEGRWEQVGVQPGGTVGK